MEKYAAVAIKESPFNMAPNPNLNMFAKQP
jgi:hypothetical protein